MKKVLLVSVLIISGCNNNAENKKNFERCVAEAEYKYNSSFSANCKHESWMKPGDCNYDIRMEASLARSKDNEITACATMYAPKQ